jgi:flagellar biogenesis protein FliO
MENAKQEKQEKEEEKKKGFGEKFINFLMYGGFIVILIVILAIVFIVEKLMK